VLSALTLTVRFSGVLGRRVFFPITSVALNCGSPFWYVDAIKNNRSLDNHRRAIACCECRVLGTRF
jgi:hypothetical protein